MTTTSHNVVTVRVLLFARFAELLGRESLEVSLPAPATVGDVVARIRQMDGGGAIPPRPLCALGVDQARLDQPIREGDELALLPPLAGG